MNVRARAPYDENLNETLSLVFANIERSSVGTRAEKDMRGLFADIDVNSPKLGNTVAQRNGRLVKILDAIGSMDLSYGDSQIDAFGDAYEYLMTMYASSAGKSGGEFFTPQEVSEVLARIAIDGRKSVGRVYDVTAPRWIQGIGCLRVDAPRRTWDHEKARPRKYLVGPSALALAA